MPAETLIVGAAEMYPSDSPDGRHSVLFEDDGETGYFYALDLTRTSNKVLDAVHIYNVADVLDRNRPSRLEVIWSEDGSKCALLINDFAHAAFDFREHRGYCRTNFPNFDNPQDGSWITADHSWSPAAEFWL